MSEELIDSYVNRQAIADDTKFLTDQLKVVLELFEKVNATKITLSGASGMKGVADSAKEAAKAVDELSAGKKKLLEIDLQSAQNAKQIVSAQVQQASGVKVLNDAYDKLVKQLITNEDRLKEVSKEMGLLQKAFNDGKLPLEKFQAKMEELRKEQISLKSTNQDATRAIRNFNKEAQGSEGSLKQMRAELNLATQAFDGLSRAEKQTDVGQQLKKQIIDLTEAIKEEEEETKRFFRNVGNYPESAKIIVDALEKATQKFNALSQAADTTPAALEDARRHMDSLRGVVDDRQFVKYAASAGDAQKEVKAFTRVLVDLEQRGEGNSQAAIDLRKHLAELTDQVADAKDAIKALASDTHSFDQFAGAVNFAVDTVQTFVGAMALSADSEEDVQEATKTLIALQTVANGIKGVATELTTRGTAANKVYAFAQNQVAIAMDSTATAGARLKAALVTLGVGALIIGIGLLIANFGKLKDAFSRLSESQKQLNEIRKEAIQGFVQEKVHIESLVQEVKNENTSKSRKIEIIKELNALSPTYFSGIKTEKDLQDKLNESVTKYIRAIELKARIKAAENALIEAEKPIIERQIELERQLEEMQNKTFDTDERKQRSIKILGETIKNGTDKILVELNKKAAPIRNIIAGINSELNSLGGDPDKPISIPFAETKKSRTGELQAEAELYENLSAVEDAHLITRLAAREKAFELRKRIAEKERDVELQNLNAQIAAEQAKGIIDENKQKEFNQQRLNINGDYNEKEAALNRSWAADILSIRQSFRAKELEIEQQYNEEFKKFQEQRLNDAIAAIQKDHESNLKEEAQGQADSIEGLNKWYEKRVAKTREGSRARTKVEEEYAKRRAQIEYEYTVAQVNSEIHAAEKIIKVKKDAGLNVVAEEKELSILKQRLSDVETQHFIDNEKKKAKTFQERMEATEKALQTVLEIEGRVSDLIGGLISANIDRQKNANQERIDDIDKRKEKEIEAVNQEAISEEEKAAKIAKINATAQVNKEAIERKQRQLDLQRARFEKAATLTRIAVETALAVVHQLASGDPYTAIGRAIAAGAFGAAQFAVAAAQPLPKFKHGRQDGPATWSITGDGGVREVVTSPDLSQAFVTPAKDTLTYLPKDWKVFPDIKTFEETAMNMAHRELPAMPIIQQNNNEGLIMAMAHSIGRLERAIINKPVPHFHWHNGEVYKSIQNGNSWDRYIQSNI